MNGSKLALRRFIWISPKLEKYLRLSPKQRFARSGLLLMDAQLELLRPLKRRLQSPVKKAAKQLKETKRAFKRENDFGLLILVNEGSALFRPSWVFYFLHHLFRGGYTSIDQILYCSVNVPASVPGIPDGARIWLPATVEGRRKISDSFFSSYNPVGELLWNKSWGLESRW